MNKNNRLKLKNKLAQDGSLKSRFGEFLPMPSEEQIKNMTKKEKEAYFNKLMEDRGGSGAVGNLGLWGGMAAGGAVGALFGPVGLALGGLAGALPGGITGLFLYDYLNKSTSGRTDLDEMVKFIARKYDVSTEIATNFVNYILEGLKKLTGNNKTASFNRLAQIESSGEEAEAAEDVASMLLNIAEKLKAHDIHDIDEDKKEMTTISRDINKKLKKIASYLGSQGLYEEAAQIKKLAQKETEEDRK